MSFVLVAEEAARLAAGTFDENAAGRPRVHRIEVIPVLDVGGVGKSELLVNSLLLFQFFVAVHGQGNMMHRAGSEPPASSGTIGIVLKDQSLSWTAGAHFEAVKLAFLAGLAEAQSFGEEALAFGHLSHREDRSIEAAHGRAGADFFGDPALSRIVRFLDDFERQSSG